MNKQSPRDTDAAFSSRAVLGNATLRWLGIGTAAFITAYFLLLFPLLPAPWRTAGSPELYLTGVAGACLLLVAMVFSAIKRGGGGDLAPKFYVAHVLCAYAGTILVAVHGAGNLGRPPAMMYLAILGLVLLGMYARLHVSRRMERTFAEKHASYAVTMSEPKRERLRELIQKKKTLLAELDPKANEGTFSLQPKHWRACPLRSLRYAKLVREEQEVMGTRRMVPFAQAYWWMAHRALAHLFVLGIVIHVITVTFFAGYVADYDFSKITWWHIAKW